MFQILHLVLAVANMLHAYMTIGELKPVFVNLDIQELVHLAKVCCFPCLTSHWCLQYCAPVAQLVEHQAVTREVVSSTPAGPTLRVFK